MSTIASPRDPGTPFPRRMNSSQAVTTPTSSSRPSLELSRSANASPNPNAGALPAPTSTKRANRAALREYYNLKKNAGSSASGSATPTLEITSDPLDDESATNPNNSLLAHANAYSEISPSELDAADFDAAAFIERTLAGAGLAELLRTYTRVLGEMRALDAEKKALVYDNYSRLISATETIRKMRGAMDPLAPMASTLDPAIARIYEQAAGIRDALRRELRPVGLGLGEGDGDADADGGQGEKRKRRERTKEVVARVLEVPPRMRGLVKEGKEEEARREWELPRRLLESWKAKGVGGDEVYTLLEEGDAILRGDDAPGRSSQASAE